MNAETFDQTLNALKMRTPYHPFTVVLVNGHRFEVDFPGALLNRNGVAVHLDAEGVPVIFDHEGVNQFVGGLMHPTPNSSDPKE